MEESEEKEESVEESNGGNAEVNEKVIEGTEAIESEEKTEVLSEENQERREEEGEVVNKEKKKEEEECKAVMRKSHVPLMREIEELRKGTRKSRRIAGRSASKGTDREVGKEESAPMEISGEKEEEEEVPLKRKSRKAPIDSVATAAEDDKLPSPGTPTRQVNSAAAESRSTLEEIEIPETPRLEQMSEKTEHSKSSPAREEPEVDEARDQAERKRKEKIPAKKVRKKAMNANPTVVIQEPI